MRRKETLTGRERVRLALEHRETDRVPIAMVCSGINEPARSELEVLLKRERGITVDAYLDPLLDIRPVGPAYIGPPLPPGEDIWGVLRRPVSFGSGSYSEIERYPLASAEDPGALRLHRWPDPAWFDYAGLPARIAALQAGGERCLMALNGNLFETSWYMRGLQRMLEDVMLEEEFVLALMGRVTDFYCTYFDNILSAAPGAIDLVFTADDIADQRGLLLPGDKWERLLRPFHERMNRVIHGHGAKVIYHSDGAVMGAVPGLVGMGIDVLQALQFSADGMDPVALKRDHGDRLCFEGGVSVQTTLPFGKPEDVRRETEDLMRVLGRGGGYVLGPSHWIQAGTPPENIMAMFDAAASPAGGEP